MGGGRVGVGKGESGRVRGHSKGRRERYCGVQVE